MGSNGRVQIAVVADPAGRDRGVFWDDEVTRYNLANDLRQEYGGLPEASLRTVRVADDVAKPHGSERNLVHHLKVTDIVIFNWDVLNGDPMFGADVTARWTSHYRSNLLEWVYGGGVLVVEGQANRSIAVQRAYDAILGDHEVRTSGEEDPLRAGIQVHKDAVRTGVCCRITRQAKASGLFQGTIRKPEYESAERTFSDYFPRSNPEHDPALQPGLKHPEPTVLWRGWFRGRWLRRRRFSWVPLLRTDRGFVTRPTLLVTRHGQGAIFVGTMHLALGQRLPLLLTALVRAQRDKSLLPGPGVRVPRVVDRPTVFAGLATILYFAVWPRLLDGEAPGWVKGLGGAGLSLVVTAAVASRLWLRRMVSKLVHG